MGCPKLHEGWVFLRGGEKHLLFPRKPREKNRSRSARNEKSHKNDGSPANGKPEEPVGGVMS